MNSHEAPSCERELSRLYAGLAASFRYPADGQTSMLAPPDYLRCFDPAVGAAAISLHESSYVSGEAGAVLEELVRFYEYFGLQRQPEAPLPDHLSVELEFMHFLCELEAAAGSDRSADAVRCAQRDFLDRHLLRLAERVAERGSELELAAARVAIAACGATVRHHRALLGQRRQSASATQAPG